MTHVWVLNFKSHCFDTKYTNAEVTNRGNKRETHKQKKSPTNELMGMLAKLCLSANVIYHLMESFMKDLLK